MRRFEASPRRAAPKGQTFINCTASPSPGPTYGAQVPAFVAHPPGQSAHIRQAHPGTRNIAPVSMPSVFVTTRQQRFACARLPDPHLTPLTAPFPRSLTTTVFSQRSTRRFGASSRKATPKGLPSSPDQHPLRKLLLHAKLLPCS